MAVWKVEESSVFSSRQSGREPSCHVVLRNQNKSRWRANRNLASPVLEDDRFHEWLELCMSFDVPESLFLSYKIAPTICLPKYNSPLNKPSLWKSIWWLTQIHRGPCVTLISLYTLCTQDRKVNKDMTCDLGSLVWWFMPEILHQGG